MQFNNYHFEWILKAEGGLINHANDKGGETKFGISKRSYPTLDIANLSIDDAQEIYKVDYFDAYRLNELPAQIGLFMFDAFVNHNPQTAGKILQHAVGARADGVIGSKTIAAANKASEFDAIEALAERRLNLYQAIVSTDSKQSVFLKGWRNRVIRLIRFIDGDFKAALDNEA